MRGGSLFWKLFFDHSQSLYLTNSVTSDPDDAVMSWSEEGNVGIGTGNPEFKLDVNGGAVLRGDVKMGLDTGENKIHLGGDTRIIGNTKIGSNTQDTTLEVSGNVKIFGERIENLNFAQSYIAETDGYVEAWVSCKTVGPGNVGMIKGYTKQDSPDFKLRGGASAHYSSYSLSLIHI